MSSEGPADSLGESEGDWSAESDSMSLTVVGVHRAALLVGIDYMHAVCVVLGDGDRAQWDHNVVQLSHELQPEPSPNNFSLSIQQTYGGF